MKNAAATQCNTECTVQMHFYSIYCILCSESQFSTEKHEMGLWGGTGDIVIEWNVAKTKHNSSSEFKCRTLHSSELQLVPVNLKAEECPLGHLKFDSDIRSNFVVFDCPFFDLEMANRAQWKLQCILFCLFYSCSEFQCKRIEHWWHSESEKAKTFRMARFFMQKLSRWSA